MKSKFFFIFLLLLITCPCNSQTSIKESLMVGQVPLDKNKVQPIDNTPINFANATLGGISAGISRSIGDNSDIRVFLSSNP